MAPENEVDRATEQIDLALKIIRTQAGVRASYDKDFIQNVIKVMAKKEWEIMQRKLDSSRPIPPELKAIINDEAAVSGLDQRQPEVEDADKGLGISLEQVRDHVRGEDAHWAWRSSHKARSC